MLPVQISMRGGLIHCFAVCQVLVFGMEDIIWVSVQVYVQHDKWAIMLAGPCKM